MHENQPPQCAASPATQQARPFIYRSVDPETQAPHPLRRSTDTPRAFQGIAGQLSPKPVLVKMRVYLKLN